jgi:hypothetical protein
MLSRLDMLISTRWRVDHRRHSPLHNLVVSEVCKGRRHSPLTRWCAVPHRT